MSTAQHTSNVAATQHSTAQHSTAQHSTAQHSTAQHRRLFTDEGSEKKGEERREELRALGEGNHVIWGIMETFVFDVRICF
jgi:hypothetical protein